MERVGIIEDEPTAAMPGGVISGYYKSAYQFILNQVKVPGLSALKSKI